MAKGTENVPVRKFDFATHGTRTHTIVQTGPVEIDKGGVKLMEIRSTKKTFDLPQPILTLEEAKTLDAALPDFKKFLATPWHIYKKGRFGEKYIAAVFTIGNETRRFVMERAFLDQMHNIEVVELHAK